MRPWALVAATPRGPQAAAAARHCEPGRRVSHGPLNRLYFPVTALGPGRRLGESLGPGCPLACPGCMSRHTWDPAGGDDVAVAALEAAWRTRCVPAPTASRCRAGSRWSRLRWRRCSPVRRGPRRGPARRRHPALHGLLPARGAAARPRGARGGGRGHHRPVRREAADGPDLARLGQPAAGPAHRAGRGPLPALPRPRPGPPTRAGRPGRGRRLAHRRPAGRRPRPARPALSGPGSRRSVRPGRRTEP